MNKIDKFVNKQLSKIHKQNSYLLKISDLKRTFEIYDKNKPVLVSIICNCYNHKNYIRDTLLSFLNQRVSFNVEILIHDDASNDGSNEIIKEFADKFPNIIKPIFQKVNQHSLGVKITDTFQKPRIKGKYVAFCEGDDMWIDEFKLFYQISALESNPTYVASLHNTINLNLRNGRHEIEKKSQPFNLYTFEEAISNKFHLSSIVVRKDIYMLPRESLKNLYKNVGDWPLKIFITGCGNVCFINRPMSLYRMFSSRNSWSSSNGANYELRISRCQELKKIYPLQIEIISRYEEECKFNLLLKNKEYTNILSSNAMKTYYKELPFRAKLSILLKNRCNKGENN